MKTLLTTLLFLSSIFIFSQDNSKTTASKEDIKALIIEQINAHGYEEDNFKQHYIATFEGDYLRLIFTRRNGETPYNKGILYDFSNVYKFQRVSKRSDKLAYINIFVSILKNEKKNKWDKHKLIMRVDSPKNAEIILQALKDYNSILLEK